ncbi:MAG: bifunctional 5,10-methylenetetrahydrofolate dehydrogenase/5,10-methenyltetrahydrofolate cyclohydrolase [Phycisphaerales bacterium]
MRAKIIDGRAIAQNLRVDVGARAKRLAELGTPARLDAILVDSGDNGARVYAENQASTCEKMGIGYTLHELPAGSDQAAIRQALDGLNADPSVHAIMVHMPLPDGVDAHAIQSRIDPDKDVEGVNPANIGNVVYGRSLKAPCTALATLRMLDHTGVNLKGQRCVVVGASAHVGRPIAVLLMQREATVISCNKFTRGINDLCRSADILIPAAGVPELIKGDMVKPGAIVVDVGVNRVANPDGTMRTVGDAAYGAVARVADWVSPVPGGVGPVTVAVLLHNVVDAAEQSAAITEHAGR